MKRGDSNAEYEEKRNKAIQEAEARKKGNFISKAKEGIKSAVGKVKNWWNGRKQKAETTIQQSTSTPQQNTTTPSSTKQDILQKSSLKDRFDEYKKNKAAQSGVSDEQAAKATYNAIGKHKRKEALQSLRQRSNEVGQQLDKAFNAPKSNTQDTSKNEVTQNTNPPTNSQEENKPTPKLRPGQRRGESRYKFYKRMRAEGKVYNKKTRIFEPAKQENNSNETSHQVADDIVNNGGKKKEEGKEVAKKS